MLMDLVDYAPRALPSGRAFADPPNVFEPLDSLSERSELEYVAFLYNLSGLNSHPLFELTITDPLIYIRFMYINGSRKHESL